MQLKLGDYELVFYNGGITIEKGGSTLYYNKRPIYAFIIIKKERNGIYYERKIRNRRS